MEKLKVGYFADGHWAHEAFKKIIKDDTIKIKFIVPRTDTIDYTLQEYAIKYSIDYLPDSEINSNEFIDKAKRYDCDLFISMSFNQIFKNEISNIPPMKIINCHAGKLPYYRGRNVLNWVLINDEKEFGITVHYIDENIDTGDILLQRCYKINDIDNYSSLLKKAYKECASIQENKVNVVKQKDIHPVGFYCSQRKLGDEVINWNQSSRDLFSFIRAINQPEGPGARAFLEDGSEVIINRAEIIKNAPNYIGINGCVLSKNNTGFIVKTSDTFLRITAYDTNAKIKVGTRFKL